MKHFEKLFVSSIPRSGSTILTNILDRYEDVFCLPESFFPVALDCVDTDEWNRKDHIAALFIVSCSDGSPLTFEEARSCIRDSKEETLDAIAEFAMRKAGRDPATVHIVVWKYTRLIGRWKFAASTHGRFLILKRNPLNVYLSQFRVPFGQKNKNPWRFALFEASYIAAFKTYPESKTRHLDYADTQTRVDDLVSWLGSNGRKLTDSSKGMGEISGKNPWHSEINKPFKNTDSEKLAMLRRGQGVSYRIAKIFLSLIPIVPRIARTVADRRQINAMRDQAQELLNGSLAPEIFNSTTT
ncbi:MAG: sulfotransferase [Akkermansiaceae bacterium]|nr:sulfotransferase [Akkermansiaceae bacterium]